MPRKLLLSLLLLSLLTGCMAKISYGFADWLIEWMVDDYIDLDKAQKQQLRHNIDKHLVWHRQTQLPRYRDWLIEFKQQAVTGLDRQWLLGWSGRVTIFWEDFMLEITPDSIELLRSLSDQQVSGFIARLDEKQQELVEEYLEIDAQERRQQRFERTEDFAKSLIGKLNNQQRASINDWNRVDGETATRLWLANRQQWTRSMERALVDRDSEYFPLAIEQLFIHSDKNWSEDYRQSIDRSLERSISLVLAIEQQLSDKQAKKLNKVLSKWINTLDKLSAS